MPANPAGTRIVTNILEHPGPGQPIDVTRPVTATLNSPGFIDGGTREKVLRRQATIDITTGAWSMVLEVNADFDPAGTSWMIKEPGNRVWTIQVPAGDPAVPVTMRSCLVSDPTAPNPIVAGVSQADFAAQVALDMITYVPGRPCSLTGTDGLPQPTGVGMEFVIGADGLDDIRYNGASL